MDANTLTLLGSWITIVGMILWQSNRHENSIKDLDTRFTDKFTGLDAKVTRLDTKVDGLEVRFDKLDARFDAMGRDVSDVRERLARIEGHLLGPESFQARGHGSPAPDEPVPEHPEQR